MKRIVVALVLMTGQAAAQETPAAAPDLKAVLMAGVPCAWGDPVGQMMLNARNAAVEDEALLAALAQIDADPMACEAVQNAAATVSGRIVEDAVRLDAAVAEAARQRLADALRAADEQAASMRFEVGLPPRHMTRGVGGNR
jgi:hypothetical protein